MPYVITSKTRGFYNQKPPVGSTINWGHPLSRGMVGCWLMNEGYGLIVNDLVANNRGVCQKNTNLWWRKPNRYISGWDFDNDSASRFQIPNKPTYQSPYVSVLCVCQHDDTTIYSRAFSKDESTPKSWGLGIGDTASLYRFYVLIGNTQYDAVGTTTTPLNQATMFVGTYDGSNIKIYRDGLLHGQLAQAGTVDLDVADLAIGARGYASGAWHGAVYTAMVWNRALQASEAKSLYQSPYQFISKPTNRFYSIPSATTSNVGVFNIQRKRYRTQKPPVGSVVDWGHPLSKGLVGCWLLNEGGGKIVQNIAQGKTGQFVNSPVWTKDTKGTGIKFESSNSEYINVGRVVGGTGSLSAMVISNSVYWVTTSRWFLSYPSTPGDFVWGINFGFSNSGNKFGVNMRNSTVVEDISALFGIQNHCFTYNQKATTLSLYRDGILRNQNTSTGARITSTNKDWYIGAGTYNGGVVDHYDHDVYYVGVWDRALSSREVMELYTAPYQFIVAPKRRFVVGLGEAPTPPTGAGIVTRVYNLAMTGAGL